MTTSANTNTAKTALAKVVVRITANDWEERATKNGEQYLNVGSVQLRQVEVEDDFDGTVESVLSEGDQIKIGTKNPTIKAMLRKCKVGDIVLLAGTKQVNRFYQDGQLVERIDLHNPEIVKVKTLEDVKANLGKLQVKADYWDNIIASEFQSFKKTVQDVITPKASKGEIENAINGSEFPDVGF